jgi:(5-formylfuran-3-yl)methyl phosphate synthase
MMNSNLRKPHPGLLVSVRNATEAIAALAGGADVIDVKEPLRGALGSAEFDTISDVIRAVEGRVPVTMAMGELADLPNGTSPSRQFAIPNGVALFKIGLAGCGNLPNWRPRWRETVRTLMLGERPALPVAVLYADWRVANAPDPDDVLALAMDNGCPALLIDTWNKSAGNLFDHWPPASVGAFTDKVRSAGIAIVLAGSLAGPALREALQLAPNFVAVRTAACHGGRNGTVSAERVRALRCLIPVPARSQDPLLSVEIL